MTETTTRTNAITWASYGAAWASRDVDKIMALHTDDAEFQLHDGRPRAIGKVAVRAEFDGIFRMFPDLESDEVRCVMAGDLVAFEYRVSTTPAGTDRRMVVEVVDVVELRDGLIWRKDTYVDTAALRAALPS